MGGGGGVGAADCIAGPLAAPPGLSPIDTRDSEQSHASEHAPFVESFNKKIKNRTMRYMKLKKILINGQKYGLLN